MKNGIKYVPAASLFLNHRRTEIPIKRKSSIMLMIHQKIHEILITFTYAFLIHNNKTIFKILIKYLCKRDKEIKNKRKSIFYIYLTKNYKNLHLYCRMNMLIFF